MDGSGAAVEIVERASVQPGPARRVATGAVLLALVVSAFEGTVVTSAMPTITRELGGQHLYSWVFSAFLFTSTLGVLVSGKLADHYGRRPVFFVGMALFLAGSALCGLAHSVPALIAFRVIQGLGAGALQPTNLTIISDLYSLRERATMQAVFTGVWGFASVLGPILGGWLVMHTSWRWIFLINVPVGVVAVGLLLLAYRDPARHADRPLDSWGPALTGSCVALLLFALEPGSAHLRVLLALGAVGVAFGLVRQQRGSPAPLLPSELLRDRTVLTGIVGGLSAGGLLYGTSAFVPLWMTEQGGHSPLTAGLVLTPLLVGWSIGSAFGVRVLMRGGLRASAGGGLALAAVGAGLLALTAERGWGTAMAFVSLGVLGMGLGPTASTSLIGPQTRASWRHRGMITSVIYATRLLGGALGVAALALATGHFALQFTLIAAMTVVAALFMGFASTGREALTPRS